MEELLNYIVHQYGVGTLLGIVTGWVAVKLWMRNNELTDARIADVHRLADKQLEMAQDIKDLQAQFKELADILRNLGKVK